MFFKEIGGCPKQNQYFWMYKEELDTKVGVLIKSGDKLKNVLSNTYTWMQTWVF